VSVQPEFLSIPQFAALSQLSMSTIRRRLRDGSIPFSQPGGKRTKILIPQKALTELANPTNVVEPNPTHIETIAGPSPKWKQQ